MYTQEENLEQISHEVHIITNGQPESVFTLCYKSHINQAQIQRAFESKWGVKLRRMRLFTDDGVEFNNDDLKYLKHKQNLYLSKGEDFDANSSFSEYEILECLGEGGFGKVNLAEHKITKELAAMKVMKVSGFGNTSEIDLVFREAQSLQALQHSNIVQIKKCYTLKDMQVIVVMEYMEGGQLLNRLREKGKFQESEAKIYFKQIVKAIIYVHNKNIIHRDLKLENILLKSKNENKVKIADFGISGVAQHINPRSCSGTLKYMPPEVLSGNMKQLSPSVDIWALGVILFYMLIGKQPFVGPTASAITAAIISGKYTVPPDSISIQAEQLISRMLDKNPETRIKAVQIRDHPWLKTSVLEILTNTMESHLQNIKQFQSRKEMLAENDTTRKSETRLKHTKSVKYDDSRSISKISKENDFKLPRLKSVHNSKSMAKRGTTLERKRNLNSMIGTFNRNAL